MFSWVLCCSWSTQVGSCSIWRSGNQNTFHTFVTVLEFSSPPPSQYSRICNNFRGALWAKPSTLSPVTVRKAAYMTSTWKLHILCRCRRILWMKSYKVRAQRGTQVSAASGLTRTGSLGNPYTSTRKQHPGVLSSSFLHLSTRKRDWY